MNISKKEQTILENVLYACYTDGGDPYCLTQHALQTLDITVENKPNFLMCNWQDHIPGGRIYKQNELRPLS